MTTMILPAPPRSVNDNGAVAPSLTLFPNSAVAVSHREGDGGLNDPLAMTPKAIASRLRSAAPHDPTLPVDLYEHILTTSVAAARRTFDLDSLFQPAQSRLTSVCASLQRRQGNLLQRGFYAAVDEVSHLVRFDAERIGVTQGALDHVDRLGHAACGDVDLGPQGAIKRAVLPDAILIDLRNNTSIGAELKRGTKLGDAHCRRLADDIAATSLLLQHHLMQRGLQVRSAEARVIAFRDAAGLRVPDGLDLSLEAFDDRFGTRATAITDAICRTHAKVAALLLRPLLAEATIESDLAFERREAPTL